MSIRGYRHKIKTEEYYIMATRLSYKIKSTDDPDAIQVNQLLNDVSRAISTGQYLDQILINRFGGDPTKFSRWVRFHLDRNQQTVLRKIVVARNADLLRQNKIVRLRDAYRLLDLESAVGLDRLQTE